MPSWRRDCGWRCPCRTPSGSGSSRSSWRSRRSSTELRDELLVEVVAELVAGFAQREPPQLVDLVVRREVAGLGAHLVVAHELGAVLVVRVRGVAELALDAAPEAGLLLDLAQRR